MRSTEAHAHNGETLAHSNAGPAKRAIFIAVSLYAAAMLSAAPAPADQTDDAFIAALQNQGISLPDTNGAIQMARTVCALLGQGTTRPVLSLRVMNEENLSARQAGFFIGASTSAYCPQYRSSSDNSPS